MSIFDKIESLLHPDRRDTEFFRDLTKKFGEESALKVLDAFDKLNLPEPTLGNQFLKSNEGSLVFVNKYGVVIRIEPKRPAKDYYTRVDDSGCILQTLGSIDAGNAVIEICPGCDVEKDEASIEYMRELLKGEGLRFSDDQLENLGRLHTDNALHPKGVLVVLDRLAVSRMKGDVEAVKNPESEAIRIEQGRFMAPFRKAFEEGLADNSRMDAFWHLLERYVAEGKIIRGWNDNSDFFDNIEYLSKTSRAEEVARYYDHNRLVRYEKKREKLKAKK